MATKRLPRPRDPLQLGKLIADIATLIDAREGPPAKRGAYRKRAA